jgi:tRNA dimethylallyltransferase
VKRLEKRIDNGMLDEIKKVLEMNLSNVKLERLGIEYAELGKYLRGECTLDEAKEKLITKIYRYAKRQKTWNKKYFPEAKLVSVET